jgi:hypothetical protein
MHKKTLPSKRVDQLHEVLLEEAANDNIANCETQWTCLHGTGSFRVKRLENHVKRSTPTTPTTNQQQMIQSKSSVTQNKQSLTTVTGQMNLQLSVHSKLQQSHQEKKEEDKKQELDAAMVKTDVLNESGAERDKPEYPPAIASGSLVSFPGKRRLCLFGGMTDKTGCINDTWIYELGLRKWRKIEFEGRERPNLNNSSSSLHAASRTEILNGTLNNFESTKCIVPNERCGHVAVSAGPNEMLLFGGQNVEEVRYFNDLWVFKPDPIPQWKMLCPSGVPPKPRWYSSAVYYEDQLILMGGEGEDYELIKELSIYSKTENKWLNLRTIFPYPSGRMLHSACIVGECMIVVGGVGKDDTSTADVWSFDTRLMQWSEIKTRGPSPFDTKRGVQKSLYGHTCSVWGNRIIVYGGRQDNGINGAVWMLDLDSATWTELSLGWKSGQFPSQRWKHMLCSDHYSHISSKSYRPDEKRNLEHLSKYQQNKYDLNSSNNNSNNNGIDIGRLQQPADILLQKLTRTYIFGGAGQSKRFGDLWEFTLSLNKQM